MFNGLQSRQTPRSKVRDTEETASGPDDVFISAEGPEASDQEGRASCSTALMTAFSCSTRVIQQILVLQGDDCSVSCPPGLYGTNCTLSCSCHNDVSCSHTDGACVCREGSVLSLINKRFERLSVGREETEMLRRLIYLRPMLKNNVCSAWTYRGSSFLLFLVQNQGSWGLRRTGRLTD